MKVKVDLTPSVIYGIAHAEALKAAGGWWEAVTNEYQIPGAEDLYAAAFRDGMDWLLNAMKEE